MNVPGRKLSPGDLFTLGNGILGFIAITYILDGRGAMASVFILFAMVFDGLDGYVARRWGSKHSIGPLLDSFSDLISFGIAPSALIYFDFYMLTDKYSLQSVLALIAAVAFFILAAVRLAWFTMHAHSLPNFSGIPTPAATFITLMIIFMFGSKGILLQNPLLVLVCCIAISILMVSPVPYPKMRGLLLEAITVVGICFALISMLLYEFVKGYLTLMNVSAIVALALLVLYVCASPFYADRLSGDVKEKGDEKA